MLRFFILPDFLTEENSPIFFSRTLKLPLAVNPLIQNCLVLFRVSDVFCPFFLSLQLHQSKPIPCFISHDCCEINAWKLKQNRKPSVNLWILRFVLRHQMLPWQFCSKTLRPRLYVRELRPKAIHSVWWSKGWWSLKSELVQFENVLDANSRTIDCCYASSFSLRVEIRHCCLFVPADLSSCSTSSLLSPRLAMGMTSASPDSAIAQPMDFDQYDTAGGCFVRFAQINAE